MSVFYRGLYILRDALESLMRFPGASLAATILTALAIFTLSSVLLLDQQLQGVAAMLESQSRMRVFLSDHADLEAAASAARRIDGVARVAIERAEDAYQRFRTSFPGGEDLLTVLDRNPFPNALLIELADARQSETVAATLRSLPGSTAVIWPQEQVPQLMRLADALRSLGVAGLAGLFVVAVLVIGLAISLSILHRHDEITIRLLLGASPFSVRLQFFFEMTLLGALGGFLGGYGAWALLLAGLERLQALLPPAVVLPSPGEPLSLLLLGVLTGALLAAGASLVATLRSGRFDGKGDVT